MLLLYSKTTGEYLLLSDDYEVVNVPTSSILRVEGNRCNLISLSNSEVNEVDESEVSNNK